MFSPTPRVEVESALVVSAASTGQRVLPWRCDQRRVAVPTHGTLVGLLGDGEGGGAAAASAMAAESLHRRNDGVDGCGVGHVRFHEQVAWLLLEIWKARSFHAIATALGSSSRDIGIAASAISSRRPWVLPNAVLKGELTRKHGAHEHDEAPPCTARNSSTLRRGGIESVDSESRR